MNWYIFIIVGLVLIVLSLMVMIIGMEKNIREIVKNKNEV